MSNDKIVLPAAYTDNPEGTLAKIVAELVRQGVGFTATAQVNAFGKGNGYTIELTGGF